MPSKEKSLRHRLAQTRSGEQIQDLARNLCVFPNFQEEYVKS